MPTAEKIFSSFQVTEYCRSTIRKCSVRKNGEACWTDETVLQDQRKKTGMPSAVFPLLKQLILACREFTSQRDDLTAISKGEKPRQPKLNYQECLKLWNMIASVLSKAEPIQPSKKPGSSASVFTLEEKVFWSVMKLIQHKNVLCLLLSCVCRMWAFINKGPTMHALLPDPLWPSTLPLQSPVNANDMKDAVQTVMDMSDAAGARDVETSSVKGEKKLFSLCLIC